jgi:flagellar hook-associated protein 3 FlgL
MRVTNSAFTDNFSTEITQLEQQQYTLQGEASSGLSVSSPDDNPSVMAQVLGLQTDSAATAAYQNNITQLQSAATTSATAMNSLQTILSQVSDIATEASNGTNSPTQIANYATQVESLIQEAVQLGNTQDSNGNYIFSGTATSTQPFTTTTANGSITSVTYNGNTDVAESEIGPSTTVSAQVPGGNSTGTGPEGLFSDSRSGGSNVFGDMISLQQNLASGNTGAIASTNIPALTKDGDNVIAQISSNAAMQSTLNTASSINSAQSLNLTTQISGETSADLAQTLTELSQTQNAYQAALESGMMVMSVSLVTYLE